MLLVSPLFLHTLISTELLIIIMETSQTLSIESFSYSWLVNIKPTFESFEESFGAPCDDLAERCSFIEMDPKLPASRRFLIGSRDFNFDFPPSDSPITLVYADELISNGLIMPLFSKPKKMDMHDNVAYSNPSTPVSSHSYKDVDSDSKVRRSSFRRCRRLSRRLFRKYREFVIPVFQILGGRSFGSKIETNDGKNQVNRFTCSASTSPRISVAYSVDNWRTSCDYESSIYEAVLHCKRSIGNIDETNKENDKIEGSDRRRRSGP